MFSWSFKSFSLVFAVLIAVTLALPPELLAHRATVESEWTRQFSSAGGLDNLAETIDVDGNVYVAGFTDGTFPGQTNSGGLDAFVRKYDTAGNELWTRQFGSSSTDFIRGISVNSTEAYVTGNTSGTLPDQTSSGSGDAFIRKYDTDGNEVWTRQFGTTGFDEAFGVDSDSTSVYVVGNTDGTFPGQTSAGGLDAFIRKYDTDGNEVWTRQFGTSAADDVFGGISIDSTDIYLTGFTEGALPGQTNSGSGDVFVRKYDTDGNEIWTRQFGSPSGEQTLDISANSSGIYLVGFTEDSVVPGVLNAGDLDVFVRKYDVSGTMVWTRQFGTVSFEDGFGIATDPTGVYIAGTTEGALPGQSNAGDSDAYLRKYSTSGDELWTHQFGTTDYDAAFGIAVDSTRVYVAGVTNGTLPGQTSSGGGDAFVIKFAQDDSDDDGIFDEVDAQPTTFSDDFNDGVTTGTITDRGDQVLSIEDAVSPADGVLIEADPSGGARPAKIDACGGATKLTLRAGDQVIVTCSSVTIEVIQGIGVEITFFTDDGTLVTTSLDEGNILTFEPVGAVVSAPDTNPGPVIILIDGVEMLLPAGGTVTIPEPNQTPTANAGGPYLVAVDSTITLDGTGFDPDGDPLTFTWESTDGNLNHPALEDPDYTAGNVAGIFEVELTVTDPGGLFTSDATMIVVYDPDGGFVTGGGWINSPEGAYASDPLLTGKANFGFVSKYKRGASTPSGETEFQFQIANLNFHSDSYHWLVVAGHKATYKGTGTINGTGNYGFMLSAVDEKLTPSTDTDLFRIKIWDKDNGDAIVYDNQMGAEDGADPTTEIAGGSIVIHKKK